MNIVIKYNSKWNNAFIEKKKNKSEYIASLSKINSRNNQNNAKEYYKRRDITLDTVCGLLYRLTGARKSLSKMLEEDNSSILYYLIDNNLIDFDNNIVHETNEVVFLRNQNISNDQNSFSGIPENEVLEIPNISNVLNILDYTKEELINFLLKDITYSKSIKITNINEVVKILETRFKDKTLRIDEKDDNFDLLDKKMCNLFNINIKNNAHLLLLSLNKATKEISNKEKKLNKYLTINKTFSGISLNGNSFTIKDFMKPFASPKIVYGNPYLTDFWVKNGEKNIKFNKALTKTSGVLNIHLNIDNEKAIELKSLIEDAGVSAFYLGKKGLAYVEKIIL